MLGHQINCHEAETDIWHVTAFLHHEGIKLCTVGNSLGSANLELSIFAVCTRRLYCMLPADILAAKYEAQCHCCC